MRKLKPFPSCLCFVLFDLYTPSLVYSTIGVCGTWCEQDEIHRCKLYALYTYGTEPFGNTEVPE